VLRDTAGWRDDGILLLQDAVAGDELRALRGWVADLERMPGSLAGLLQYDEQTPGGPRRCRTENFVPFHPGLRTLVTTGLIPRVAGELLGEPARLYKEKVNYKAPGGAGFAPHQDAPAYPFVRTTLACMVAVDDATPANGCLEVVRRCHGRPLPTDGSGCIAPEVAARLEWEPLPATAGSLLFFGCHVPHRSGPNTTDETRRAIYLTFNAASDGDLRAAYYAAKIPQLAEHPDRISLIGHFAGSARPVIDEGPT
jgi:2-aminoethylphosphonate dioxygenase